MYKYEFKNISNICQVKYILEVFFLILRLSSIFLYLEFSYSKTNTIKKKIPLGDTDVRN